uniref:Rho-GAP domain-containing protein n=1 Tax=Meleagris gallopavo TaxID=9103 RepID=G1MV15_MELGA
MLSEIELDFGWSFVEPQELDSVFLVGPIQLWTFYDSNEHNNCNKMLLQILSTSVIFVYYCAFLKNFLRCSSHHTGLQRVGIFRISGSVNKIKELKQKYNQGEEVDLINHGDVDSVASLLKLFLNELPVAVLPDNYPQFTFFEHLLQLISCLPKAHQNLLQFLSAFLLKVATYSAVNCMTLENLAIVFGPALFKALDILVPLNCMLIPEQWAALLASSRC